MHLSVFFVQRDSWMMESAMESIFGGESQAERRAKKEKEKAEKERQEVIIAEVKKMPRTCISRNIQKHLRCRFCIKKIGGKNCTRT